MLILGITLTKEFQEFSDRGDVVGPTFLKGWQLKKLCIVPKGRQGR